MSTVVNVVAWNLNNGDRPSFPNELASLPEAVAYAFSETAGHNNDLDRWAKRKGLRCITGVGDIGSNVQLYLDADRVSLVPTDDPDHYGVEIVHVTWRGPKGKPIAGRSFVWALVEVDGVPLLLVAVHGPWNPVKNFRAWRAYWRAVRRLARHFPSVDMLLVGDLNQSFAKRVAWSIRRTAWRLRARVVPTALPVDYGLFRPRRRSRWTVTARKGARMLSDHAYVLYRLVKREAAR